MQWQWQLDDASATACAAVVDAVAAVGHARPEAARRVTRRLLDTVDERLADAGYALEVDSRPRYDAVLSLRAHDSPQGEQWTSARLPGSAGDVPRARLAARLARLSDERALLPRCRADLVVHRCAWFDALDKRIAVVDVEHVAARGEDPALLLVAVHPVRGFERASARLLSVLRRGALAGAHAIDRAVALRRARGGPVYRAKPIVDLRTDMPAAAALSTLFRAYGEVLWANERGIVADLDREFLHDYRVALRSLRSWTGDLRKVMSRPARARVNAELAALNRATGRLRDLDVLGGALPGYLAALGGIDGASTAALTTLVTAARIDAQRALVTHFGSTDYRRFRHRWRRLCRHLDDGRHLGRDGDAPLREVVVDALRRRLAAVLDFDQARAYEEPALLHELRKECKKLRYLLEGFQRLFDESTCRRAIAELKTVQTAMGDTWDLHVHHALLTSLSADLPPRSRAARALLPVVVGLGTRLNALERAHTEIVSRAYARFRSAPVQRIYRRLLDRP